MSPGRAVYRRKAIIKAFAPGRRGFAGLLLACHALALHLVAQRAGVVSLSFLTLTPALAAWTCLNQGRKSGSQGWCFLALALLLWAGGMAADGLLYLALGNASGETTASMLLFVLYGVPLIFTTASPKDDPWLVRVIDAVLALLLGVLFFMHTATFSTMTGTDEQGSGSLARMFDIENGFIALFVLTRLSACRKGPERAFFEALASFSVLYAVTAAYINHVQQNSDYGGFVDLLIDLPFLAVMTMACRSDGRDGDYAAVPLHRERLVQAVSPLMLPAMVLAVAAALMTTRPIWTMAGFAMATLIYGLRNVFVHLANLEERDRLERLSQIDGLTNLPNRRSFDARLQEEWARSRRNGSALAIMMIDIDHFKQLNDALGHPEGDSRLREVARALAGCARRAGDMVARYGGEEFVVILPGAGREKAAQLADIMRKSVEQLALPSPAETGYVTVSIGVCWGDGTQAGTALTLLSQADVALYEAKRGGRNAVCVTTLSKALHVVAA